MSNNIIVKGQDATLFCMPSLENESIRKIEEIERQAYEEGFASGEKAGFAEGEQKAVVLIDSLHRIIEEIAQFKGTLVENLESQAVDLSICIARKVINEEVKTRPEVIVAMVKESLRRLQRSGTITVKINPVLHDLFMEKKAELLEVHGDIVFDVHTSIAVAGPIVVSQIEEVVTDVESLLDNLIDELTSGRSIKQNERSSEEILAIGNQALEEQIAEPYEMDDLTIATAIQDEVEDSNEQN